MCNKITDFLYALVMVIILRYSTEVGRFGANYVKVVEDRPILFPTQT